MNFALPDLRGRAPIHVGSGHTLGERGGEQAHTLSIAEIPTHTHVAAGDVATTARRERHRRTRVLARVAGAASTRAPANLIAHATPGRSRTSGGSQAHLNMQPFLTLSFCIALQGIFPSPT